ncbi:MAG: hypothetical protein ABSG36_11575 [Acidimicrobiales bacterium]
MRSTGDASVVKIPFPTQAAELIWLSLLFGSRSITTIVEAGSAKGLDLDADHLRLHNHPPWYAKRRRSRAFLRNSTV